MDKTSPHFYNQIKERRKDMKKKTAIIILCSLSVIFAGCSINKNQLINKYNDILNLIGKKFLTSDEDLMGERIFYVDTNTGKYTSLYKDENIKEVIFGSVEVNRKTKNINIEYKADIKKGKAKIIIKNDSKTRIIASFDIEGPESGGRDLTLTDGEYYLSIIGEDFSGEIEITAKYI